MCVHVKAEQDQLPKHSCHIRVSSHMTHIHVCSEHHVSNLDIQTPRDAEHIKRITPGHIFVHLVPRGSRKAQLNILCYSTVLFYWQQSTSNAICKIAVAAAAVYTAAAAAVESMYV